MGYCSCTIQNQTPSLTLSIGAKGGPFNFHRGATIPEPMRREQIVFKRRGGFVHLQHQLMREFRSGAIPETIVPWDTVAVRFKTKLHHLPNYDCNRAGLSAALFSPPIREEQQFHSQSEDSSLLSSQEEDLSICSTS